MPKYRAVIHYEGFVETEIDAEDEYAAEHRAIAEFENFSPAEIESNVCRVSADITEYEWSDYEEDEQDG